MGLAINRIEPTEKRRRAGVVAALLTCLVACLTAAVTLAAPASANDPAEQMRTVDFNNGVSPCVSALANPYNGVYLGSAIVTVKCADATIGNPPPARQTWSFEGFKTGWTEIASYIPNHNNLCISENVSTHLVELRVCGIYYTNIYQYPSRWWQRVDVTAPDGSTAARYVNHATGRCMAVQTINATNGQDVYTVPCQTYEPSQLWQRRLVAGGWPAK